MNHWFEVKNIDQLLSPALLFYPERIQSNIDQMIQIAGSANRIRSHVKTYKCREIVQMQMVKGITKFKCATLSEALMLAESGAEDILLAYPLIGPAQKKFIQLVKDFPKSKFSVLIDHAHQLQEWNDSPQPVNIIIDLDVGMHRTGTSINQAEELFRELKQSPHKFIGWHIYDGHIHQTDIHKRTAAADTAYKDLNMLIQKTGSNQGEVICGSSSTFPIHARHTERQLSPGTTLLWDQGYTSNFPDLRFDIAATIMTRIVSKPDDRLLCLDLGYKAVASEMAVSPIHFPQIPDAKITVHSEEHLVIETEQSWKIGEVLYGFPWHICPTVALHEKAAIIKDQEFTGFWTIDARNRLYEI